LLPADAQKVHYHSYCQRVQRDQRKLEKGSENAQNENLNLVNLISIVSGSVWSFYLNLMFGWNPSKQESPGALAEQLKAIL